MKKPNTVQLTVRGLPEVVAEHLKVRAQAQGKSLNKVVIEALTMGAGLAETPLEHHDLDWIAGTWVEDSQFDEAVATFRKIDEGMWR